MIMTRVQTIVQLTDDLVAALDAAAKQQGVSRSALIREAVIEFLDRHRRADAIDRYIEGYRRIPPGIPDAWGDLDAEADRAGREVGQRMDAESDQAGMEW